MRALPLILAALLARSAVAADPAPSLLGDDGRRLHGQPRLEARTLRVDEGAVALDRVVALDCPGEIAGWLDQGVVLVDGEVIRGVVRGLKQDTLEFASDLLGPLQLPTAQVAAAVFTPVRTVDAGAPTGDFAGVVLANGDRVKGTPAFVDERAVGVDNGRKVVQIPRARARLLVMHPFAGAAGSSRQVIRLANGDRLAGALTALAGDRFTLTNPLGAWTLLARDLRALWSEGGALVPLDRLAPKTTAGTARFGESFATVIDAARGDRLTGGGRSFERAIGSHASATISYDLGGGYGAFVAEAALAPGPGSAVMKVVVDGKAVFDSGPLTAADAPRPVRVALNGAHELALLVEPGPDGDTVGDRGVWGWPTLVRP